MTDIPQEILDKYRDWNVSEGIDWWDTTFEKFVEDMAAKGIQTDTEKVWFRGFWSQGDGACYKGYIETRKFLDAHPHLREEFPHHAALNALDEAEPQFSIEKSGSYTHEFTMSLTMLHDVDTEQHFNMDEPLGAHAHKHLDDGINSELEGLEESVLEIVRGYAKTLYENLEEEYEYLTSDEAVKEAIEANDLWTPDEGAA